MNYQKPQNTQKSTQEAPPGKYLSQAKKAMGGRYGKTKL